MFIGIVFLAVIGGAAESGSAIAMARKNKLDLTVGIAMGSSIQIALFVAPVLVLLSGVIAPQPLELSFSRAEIGTLFLGVLIGAIVAGDGRSNWYKGVQLMLVYAMIAILFYFLPDSNGLSRQEPAASTIRRLGNCYFGTITSNSSGSPPALPRRCCVLAGMTFTSPLRTRERPQRSASGHV